MARRFTLFAGVFGLLAVIGGTFGAHGLDGRVSEQDLSIWETAVRYHMYHALALLGVAWASERWPGGWIRAAGWLMTAGIIIFAGSLYLLATSELLTGRRQAWWGMITPIGGVSFLLGWTALLIGTWRAKRKTGVT